MNKNQNNNHSIQTINLTKKFGNITAVDRINLTIKKGEVFSILGHNGAGKTTTIKLLCCLLKPTSGTAFVAGQNIKDQFNQVKQNINISPQETAVASHLTTYENLFLIGRLYGLTKEETKNRTKKLMEQFGLAQRAGDAVRKLSGGMQRRLSIAMALVSDPQILFLDEPSLGLDPQARRKLWQQIEKLKGLKTIILTTHYMEEADALSDRIALMKSGIIDSIGTPEEIKNQFTGQQTMIVRGRNLNEDVINKLKRKYPYVNTLDNGIEIKGEKLVFDEIVDFLRLEGVKIDWFSMKETTLDDVFLSLNKEI
jgi:ABC-2 type transport system ATP-binding protein